MFEIEKELEINGAHHLNLPYDSPCNNIHGHLWKVKIYCRAKDSVVDENKGMVVDFSIIKRLVHGELDHKNLNEIQIDKSFPSDNPTAENLARWICNKVPYCYKVDLWETPKNKATYIKKII